MANAVTACVTCGTALRAAAKFCDECGARIAALPSPAEYKHVTVLFADVVHSMDIAAAVGPERLREIMAELVTAAAAVVQRFGGTVDKFTGDGIMAVFGAPVALEDHAFRACLAALGIQDAITRLAADVTHRDGIDLQLRVGLNSGQVIAGEIGSAALGYTAIGEQVGMAQRMESAAPPGGVMLSASTARLVRDVTVLAEQELVRIKGATDPVPGHRLITTTTAHRVRTDPELVGRIWELQTITGLLDEAGSGIGCVIGVVGPPGIGKSRIVREAAALAHGRGIKVFTTYCESHTSDIPFHAVTGLLRAALEIGPLDDEAARAQVRELVPDADPEDLMLLDDLLGIADPGIEPPAVEADARRRRLTALVNAASLSRTEPVMYVIEDAHWVDEASESMFADFLAVIPQTASLVLITYRPEYRGALTTMPGAQTIALRPLNSTQTAALIGGLLGGDSSVRALTDAIAERVCGNPFFAEEMVRDLAERGALKGVRGSYLLHGEVAATLPPTLHAAIAARVDRLSRLAKRTLNAAAVIGSRFTPELVALLGVDPVVEELVHGELIDQIGFTPQVEYAFRHPLIRAVAYESQLKSDRAELHRRLAAAIEQRQSADENAPLIAEHLSAAGDLSAAFDWHMRAGTWLTHRDITAARASWRHARDVADRLADADHAVTTMRVAPRTLLCASAWMAGGSMADTGFDELRALASAAGDQVSLATGMAGWLSAALVHARFHEGSRLAAELVDLLESIGDPTLTLALSYSAVAAKYQRGEISAALELTRRMIELADGDAAKGDLIIGSPLAAATLLQGCAKCFVGNPEWRTDVDQASALVRAFDPTLRAIISMFKYVLHAVGAWLPDDAALQETAEMLDIAERSGDNLTLACAQYARGLALASHPGPEREDAHPLMSAARNAALHERSMMSLATFIDVWEAGERIRYGLEGAVELSRVAVETDYASGDMTMLACATDTLVRALLQRGETNDVLEAQAAVERLASEPTEPGFIMNELWLLRMRAVLARAHGDDEDYRDYLYRYREMANSLGFEGHIAWAKEMQ